MSKRRINGRPKEAPGYLEAGRILNGLDAGPHLLRNMRAEERPDGVACQPVALAISAGAAGSFRRRSSCLAALAGPGFLPRFRGCCHLLRGPLVPARSVFSRFANRFSVCDLWSDSGVFLVFQQVAIFRECKTWLDAREDERSKLAERRSRKMRWRIGGLIALAAAALRASLSRR